MDVRYASSRRVGGIRQVLGQDKSWIDYVQADSHEDSRVIRWKRASGGLPLLNSPEIICGAESLGGFGVNPFPRRLQRLWNETGRKLSGGFPYSEGIYEDLNKVICTQFYWNRTVRPRTSSKSTWPSSIRPCR